MKDWIIFLFVHLLIPIIGITIYVMLVKKMKKEEIPNPPITQLFWVFGTYGVFIILILTSLIWKWSGMASIGAFASLTIGPIIACISAYSVYKNRRLTRYHKLTYWLSIVYVGFVVLAISSSIIYNGIK